MLAYIAAHTGRTIKETGELTRVEAGLLYTALRQAEIRRAAHQTLYLLPAMYATGELALGQKKSVSRASDDFKNLRKELIKQIYG